MDGGRVPWSSADGRLSTGDGNSNGCITTGFQHWNMDSDVGDQYGTCNNVPVYYGGDLCDSEDSDWDDLCALAGAACVEDYGFDVPEGMDPVVHRHGRIPESSDVRRDCQMDVTPVYRTVSYATRDEWNASDCDSLTMTADENDPDMNDCCQRVVSSDDKNCLDSEKTVTDLDGSRSEGVYRVFSDDGSAEDLDVDMISLWMAPWDAGGTFRMGSRPEMATRRDRLRCVVQYFGGLAWTSVIDLYAGVSTAPVEIIVEDQKPDFLALACQDSRGRYGYSPVGGYMTDLGFPRVRCSPVEMCAVDSNFPRVSCSPVEMCAVDSNFPRFPLGKFCAERLDYIRRASVIGLPVCTRTVTGSLLFGSPQILVRGSSCSTLFLHRWTDELEVFPVDGRWTCVRVQSVHAYLLVIFDYFFFSSGLTAGTVIITTGILFAHGRLVLCRYRQSGRLMVRPPWSRPVLLLLLLPCLQENF